MGTILTGLVLGFVIDFLLSLLGINLFTLIFTGDIGIGILSFLSFGLIPLIGNFVICCGIGIIIAVIMR